jgi:hypothetical protein
VHTKHESNKIYAINLYYKKNSRLSSITEGGGKMGENILMANNPIQQWRVDDLVSIQ